MKLFTLHSPLFTLFILLFTSNASALDLNIDGLSYSDMNQFSQEEAAAISVLTEMEIVQGNNDGSFRPRATLNRAEFMTIAMRLLNNEDSSVDLNCFPDVLPDAWYAQAVCSAKELGIVNGNAIEGVSENEWLFAPDRAVQYEEAIKVLVGIFNIPIKEDGAGESWFLPYINVANSLNIGLDIVFPGDKLFRGEMAVLTAKFHAYVNGELDALLDVMSGNSVYSSASSESTEVGSNSSVSSSAPAEGCPNGCSDSSELSFVYDPLGYAPSDSDFLSLGEVSPVLASAKAFSELEPINITDFIITLENDVSSLDAFLVYDETERFLGMATKDTSVVYGKTYKLSVNNLNIQFPKLEEYGFYVRARIKSYNEGGISGEVIQVNSLGLQGTGEWTSNEYSESSFGDYLPFQTSRSRIVSIENNDSETGFLVPGDNLEIASFKFSGEKGAVYAELRVTDLSFGIGSVGSTTVANVKLGAQGVDGTMDCSVASSTITCSNIESKYGSFDDSDRVVVLYGDVAIDESFSNRSLQIVLNRPGSVGTAGDITWTDGDTSFEWVQLDSPISRGTKWE